MAEFSELDGIRASAKQMGRRQAEGFGNVDPKSFDETKYGARNDPYEHSILTKNVRSCFPRVMN